MISASRLRQTWSSGSRGSKYCLSCVCVEFVETNIWIETSSCREMTRAPDDRLETLKDSPAPPQHTYAYTHTHTHTHTSPPFLFKTSDYILLVNFLKLLERRWHCVCAVYESHTANHQQVYFPPVFAHSLLSTSAFNSVIVMLSAWWRWGTRTHSHRYIHKAKTHSITETCVCRKTSISCEKDFFFLVPVSLFD